MRATLCHFGLKAIFSVSKLQRSCWVLAIFIPQKLYNFLTHCWCFHVETGILCNRWHERSGKLNATILAPSIRQNSYHRNKTLPYKRLLHKRRYKCKRKRKCEVLGDCLTYTLFLCFCPRRVKLADKRKFPKEKPISKIFYLLTKGNIWPIRMWFSEWFFHFGLFFSGN